MTDAELDGKKEAAFDKSTSRVIRVAKGSGTSPAAVGELLSEHKRFEKMIGYHTAWGSLDIPLL